MAQKEEKVIKSNPKLSILLIVIAIILILGSASLGYYLGSSSMNEDNNKESDNTLEDNKNEDVVIKIIDEEEAPNKTVVELDSFEVQTSVNKLEYVGESTGYVNGYIGYYDYKDEIWDEDNAEFVPLYECQNKEIGKCGYANPLVVDGRYNLEEAVSLGTEMGSMIGGRYIFIYDSNIYLKDLYSSYFNEDIPLIIYDTVNKKEIGRYAAVYYSEYYNYDNYLVVADFNNKFGIIKIENGNVIKVLDHEYDYIGHLYESKQYMLVKDGQYYVYNVNTKEKVGPFNNQIASYSEKYIVTNEGSYEEDTEKNYRLYGINGNKILVDSGYEYMEIAGDYVIVIDRNKTLNVYDQNGKAILGKSIDKLYGTYHIRCCAALMVYGYEINNDVMELYVNRDVKGQEIVETYKYVIDLKNKTYTEEVYISEE